MTEAETVLRTFTSWVVERPFLYPRLAFWAQRIEPCAGSQVYTWRHSLMCRLSRRFEREYDEDLERIFREAFKDVDCSQIQAGVLDASKLQVIAAPETL